MENETRLAICQYSFTPLENHILYFLFYALCYQYMINRVIASNVEKNVEMVVSSYEMMARRIDRVLYNIDDASMWV